MEFMANFVKNGGKSPNGVFMMMSSSKSFAFRALTFSCQQQKKMMSICFWGVDKEGQWLVENQLQAKSWKYFFLFFFSQETKTCECCLARHGAHEQEREGISRFFCWGRTGQLLLGKLRNGVVFKQRYRLGKCQGRHINKKGSVVMKDCNLSRFYLLPY